MTNSQATQMSHGAFWNITKTTVSEQAVCYHDEQLVTTTPTLHRILWNINNVSLKAPSAIGTLISFSEHK